MQSKNIETEQPGTQPQTLLQLTEQVVSSFLSRNALPATELPRLIRSVHASLVAASQGRDIIGSQKPAVPIKKSIAPDYLVCLEDGKRLKMLKRYIRSRFGLSPEAYRAKWGLDSDYPMVAPNYSVLRSDFAKALGLGKRHLKRRRSR